MAKPSKQRPWVVQMNPPNMSDHKWFDVEAFRSEDEADMTAALYRKRAPEATFRVINILTHDED